ncbi:MAG: polysaccharide biosynthesis/export family protein [Ignavibacteriales bacterium]
MIRLDWGCRATAAVSAALALAACAGSGTQAGDRLQSANLPPPTPAAVAPAAEYVIGPLDKLSIAVFQVPELTQSGLQVDAGGELNLPLIGGVQAAGKTTQQLSQEIAARLSKSYLQNPQVSVSVDEANSQKFTVEGAVTQPGVFPIAGPTTLLQAIAMARGPDKTADVRRVAIFRNIDGKRAAAVFDLGAIRSGSATDPEVYGGDIVVVQSSGMKNAWQEILRAAPAIGLFRYF